MVEILSTLDLLLSKFQWPIELDFVMHFDAFIWTEDWNSKKTMITSRPQTPHPNEFIYLNTDNSFSIYKHKNQLIIKNINSLRKSAVRLLETLNGNHVHTPKMQT